MGNNTPVRCKLAALSSAKYPDFAVLVLVRPPTEARLLPCKSKIEYGKQELSFKL